jgi:hypothetical protein
MTSLKTYGMIIQLSSIDANILQSSPIKKVKLVENMII